MRITWDTGNRDYASGVSQGVLYPENSPGVPWNGLLSVTEAGGKGQESKYIDGRRYSTRNLTSTFSGTISAYTYPDEFAPYAGIFGIITGQRRRSFGFSYRTSNEIHLVYNAFAAPSGGSYSTIGEKVDPIAFEWKFTTLPVKIPGGKPSSHLVISVDDSQAAAIAQLEALLYGTDTDDPRLPLPEEVISVFETYTTLRITDNGDGTWTASDSGQAITIIDGTTFKINWPSVMLIPSLETFLKTWDFENDVTGWGFWGTAPAAGTVAQSSAWAKSGSYSCLTTITVQGASTNEVTADVVLDPGDYLTVVFTVYVPTARSGLNFGADWKTSAGTYISHSTGISGVNLAAGEERTLRYKIGPAPDTAGKATLTFALPNGSPVGASMALDDVSCFIQKPTTTYKISSL
jgi:hypothetical protein